MEANSRPDIIMFISSLRRLGLAAALATLLPTAAGAQAPQAEAEVRAVIDRLFAGMRSGDSTAVRATLHPEARLITTSGREGQPTLRVDAIDDFVRAVGTPHPEVWDERISNVVIHVDDALAVAWMDYRFHLGERLSHCGVNAFQFFRGSEGWRVIQITDTRRVNCS